MGRLFGFGAMAALGLAACHRQSAVVADAGEPATALRIESEPPGAAVAVDGVATGRLTPTEVAVQAYAQVHLKLTLAEHAPWEGTAIGVPSGEPVRARLVALHAFQVETTPPGARILSGSDVLVSQTPGSFTRAAGTVALRVEKAGYVPVERSVTFDADHLVWRTNLAPAAYLTVTSSPQPADIELDGIPTGLKTPQERLALPAGVDHTISVHAGELTSPVQKIRRLRPGGKASAHLTCVDAEAKGLAAEWARRNSVVQGLQRSRDALAREASAYEFKDALRYAKYLKRLETLDGKIGDAEERANEVRRELDAG